MHGSVSNRRALMFVLGSLLHSLYTSPLGDIQAALTHDMNFQFKPAVCGQHEAVYYSV